MRRKKNTGRVEVRQGADDGKAHVADAEALEDAADMAFRRRTRARKGKWKGQSLEDFLAEWDRL